MSNKLATVHDAVREATSEVREESQHLKPATYKVSEDVKELANGICESNGTTLSAYLRWCCILLVEDYMPGRTKRRRKEGVTQLPVGRRE